MRNIHLDYCLAPGCENHFQRLFPRLCFEHQDELIEIITFLKVVENNMEIQSTEKLNTKPSKDDLENLVGKTNGGAYIFRQEKFPQTHDGYAPISVVQAVQHKSTGIEFVTWIYNHEVGGFSRGDYRHDRDCDNPLKKSMEDYDKRCKKWEKNSE